MEEEQDWGRNRYIKIFDYFRLVEGDTLAILNMRSKLDTEEKYKLDLNLTMNMIVQLS